MLHTRDRQCAISRDRIDKGRAFDSGAFCDLNQPRSPLTDNRRIRALPAQYHVGVDIQLPVSRHHLIVHRESIKP